MTRIASATLAPLCLLAAACTMAQAPPVTDAAEPPPADLALEIAAAHLSVDVDELELVRIEPVEWRDSAIGCPDPGMSYLQVITPGHFALVKDGNGVMHRVHLAGGHGIVCEKPPVKPGQGPEPMPLFSQRQLEALARADLAQRLHVPASEVSVAGSRSVEWPDASLGCGAGEGAPPGGASKGFVITLSHAGRRYTYHSDLRQAIPCPPIESR